MYRVTSNDGQVRIARKLVTAQEFSRGYRSLTGKRSQIHYKCEVKNRWCLLDSSCAKCHD